MLNANAYQKQPKTANSSFFAKHLWSLDVEVQYSKNVNNCAIKNVHMI